MTDPEVDDVRRTVIEHACQRLMVRYCHHIDHGDADGFASIFAEDATYKPAAVSEPIRGREAIREWARAYPRDRLVRHLSTAQLVEVLDGERATGRSYAVVWREPEPREDAVSARVTPRSVVEYFDEFRRTEEGWRISSRYYQVTFMDPEETVRPLPWSPPGTS